MAEKALTKEQLAAIAIIRVKDVNLSKQTASTELKDYLNANVKTSA